MQRQESVQKVPFTPAIYQTAPSVRERTATLIAVVMVHAALALALLNLSGTPRLPLPDGLSQLIDVTAEPPEHFATTLASLGFDPAAGDLPIDESPPPTRDEKKAKARQHAKQIRKGRRGERRGRGGPERVKR